MSQVQQLLESAASGWKNVQSDAAKLAAKWQKTGLLEGLKSETDKNNMSMLLENQAKQLVTETSAVGSGLGGFSTGQSPTGNWAGIALPLVRKVFGQISAKEFVSVQPMNLPSGLVFYLDFQYGTGKTPFGLNNSLYGNTGSSFPFSTNPNNLTTGTQGGLYGAGKFTFSTNQTSSTPTATLTATSASWAQVNFTPELSASVALGNIKRFTVAATTLPGADLDAVRGFVFSSGSTFTTSSNRQLPEFTTYDGTNVVFYVTGSSAEVQIRAVWTPEFAQDLNAYQSIDAEAEVTNIMSEYISLEIDLEILEMLIDDAAAGTEYWSAQNNRVINAAGTEFSTDTAGFYNTQGQWFQTLGTKMQKLSNRIHQLTLRGGANWLVTSPTVATILESIPGFASNSDGNPTKMEYAFGVQKAGQMNSRYTVYKNPYMTENLILMGFRGTQFLEAGAVFAPYVPLIMTPLIYDPTTFVPRKGLLTRYAKKMLRPEFYGKIYIAGLNTI